MASDTDNLRIPFSEGHEYEWVKIANSEDFKVHPEYRTDRGRNYKRPPAPLSLVADIVEETLGYPEVLKVIFLHMQPDDYPEKPVKNLALWYAQYLHFKHGNRTSAWTYSMVILKQIVNEKWTGLDDPKCGEYLEDKIESGLIVRDEQRYDQ